MSEDQAVVNFAKEVGINPGEVHAVSILGGMNKVKSALTKRHHYWLDSETGQYVKEPR